MSLIIKILNKLNFWNLNLSNLTNKYKTNFHTEITPIIQIECSE